MLWLPLCFEIVSNLQKKLQESFKWLFFPLPEPFQNKLLTWCPLISTAHKNHIVQPLIDTLCWIDHHHHPIPSPEHKCLSLLNPHQASQVGDVGTLDIPPLEVLSASSESHLNYSHVMNMLSSFFQCLRLFSVWETAKLTYFIFSAIWNHFGVPNSKLKYKISTASRIKRRLTSSQVSPLLGVSSLRRVMF